MHITPLQLRFSDIDSLGHVNNSVYFTLMDLAKARYFLDVLGHDLNISEAGVVVVNVNCDFCAPAFFGEELAVRTSTVRIGEKSFVLSQEVFDTVTDSVKCCCRTVMCGFDPHTSTSIPIKDEWREALERFEGKNLSERHE